MPDIGKAYVQIVPSAAGISGSIAGLLAGESMTAGAASGAAFSGGFKNALIGFGGLAVAKEGFDFFTGAVETGMEFNAAMSQVAATMETSVDQIGALEEAARAAGRTTRYNATEVAEAFNYMALAGYTEAESLEMMPNVLNLAAAGNMDLARASDMLTDSQTALNLSTDGTVRLVDQLARAASHSNASVAEFGDAVLTVGGYANYLAGGTTELLTVLGLLADNSVKGSEGGTHLRNMLLSLTSPTKDARETMEQLGVSIFDAEGNMRSFADFFPELKEALDGLTDEKRTQALAAIFNARDIASAEALLNTSVERWKDLDNIIDECQGSAQQMADTQLDNLQGDVLMLKNTFNDLKLTIAEEADPALRKFVQGATGVLSDLNDVINGDKSIVDVLGTDIHDFSHSITEKLYGDEFVKDGSALMMTSGRVLISSLAQGMTDNLGGVHAATDSLIAGMSGTLSGLPTYAYGSDAANNFAAGVEDNTGGVQMSARSLIAGVSGTLSGLPTYSWGLDAANNFAAGMSAGENSVISAASNIASAAAAWLHHSTPDIGPMADDDVWGYDFVENFAAGMRAGAPMLRREAENVAGAVRDTMRFDAQTDRRGAGYEAAELVSAINDAANRVERAMGGMGFYIDGERVAEVVDRRLGTARASDVRRSLTRKD